MPLKAKLILPFLAASLLPGFALFAADPVESPSIPEVNVVNTPDVNVVNTPQRIPWSANWSITATGFNKSLEILKFPDEFPDDSYLVVIETVSYRVEVPRGQHINVRLCFNGEDTGPFTAYMPHVSPWSDYTTDTYADTVQMRVYAGGGSFSGDAIKAFLSRDSSAGNAEFTVNVMGYFLPQDSPTLSP
jgi:hypothetical protein